MTTRQGHLLLEASLPTYSSHEAQLSLAHGSPDLDARPQCTHCSHTQPRCHLWGAGATPASIWGVAGAGLGEVVAAPAPHGCPTCRDPWQLPLLQHLMGLLWTWPPRSCPHTALVAEQEISSPRPLKQLFSPVFVLAQIAQKHGLLWVNFVCLLILFVFGGFVVVGFGFLVFVFVVVVFVVFVFLKKVTAHIMCDITFVLQTRRDLKSWSGGSSRSLRLTTQADCLLPLLSWKTSLGWILLLAGVGMCCVYFTWLAF